MNKYISNKQAVKSSEMMRYLEDERQLKKEIGKIDKTLSALSNLRTVNIRIDIRGCDSVQWSSDETFHSDDSELQEYCSETIRQLSYDSLKFLRRHLDDLRKEINIKYQTMVEELIKG